MPTDIEIAQRANLQRIGAIAAKAGIPDDAVEPYGHYKAKISLDWLAQQHARPGAKLVLVTAISPTPAGEGKTTATVGLGDALNRLGRKTMICLREPSMGPVFGIKGGAAGGGHAQVVPMEDINLHFTGDFAAIAQAHNLLAAAIDNHIHHGNALGIDPTRIRWKRVMDMNDRALRSTVVGLGGPINGQPREDGFDIVVASEVMAIFCLATSLADLRMRLGNIVFGVDRQGMPLRARQLNVHGAMTVLLRDAIKPNLVQTLENNPALVHGGPFANIAHGCSSVIATQAGLKLADYVVTEAGFGADLGAEKFLDIKCRKADLWPDACVIVATVRALKYNGGVPVKELATENLDALKKGLVNLERHVDNITGAFGLPAVVAINRFDADTDAELALIRDAMRARGVDVVLAEHWAKGGAGAEALAQEVIRLAEQGGAVPGHGRTPHFLYPDDMPLWDKLRTVATRIYGAADIVAPAKVRKQIDEWQAQGYGSYPICVAKTAVSFSADPTLLGAPSGHTVNVRDVRLSAGAGFIVMICGDIMTMPGLPKAPSAERIDIGPDGRVVGLF
ncbi:formate--tetrahydrofolate ligase [Lautropia dentalis]|uniref:Formate--tetrahydrofolate ligase n=1 Tax=Lautropia dentalis TaxID=2490857 RepID=A0A3R8NU15_9BURK|nr:formate--tetrahydrofolate ligase [Lautropia dentalis]RRN45827.1 formate--tetrahydrofolate ligase [Lautropia dentalis]